MIKPSKVLSDKHGNVAWRKGMPADDMLSYRAAVEASKMQEGGAVSMFDNTWEAPFSWEEARPFITRRVWPCVGWEMDADKTPTCCIYYSDHDSEHKGETLLYKKLIGSEISEDKVRQTMEELSKGRIDTCQIAIPSSNELKAFKYCENKYKEESHDKRYVP